MDLLATVKKTGTRGGTGDFKWSEVQTSSHREHYMGHSLMAPVGRWQKGRDLNWYAKTNDETGGEDEAETAADKAARQRADEIKHIKEAEQDAMARALGLPVPDRSNPNTEALGNNRRDMEKMVKDAADDGSGGGKGVGYGAAGASASGGRRPGASEEDVERIEGNAEQQDRELQSALKEYERRHAEKGSRRRSRSRSRDRDRKHHHHHRSQQRPRDRDRERDREGGHHHHRRRKQNSRSSSPARRPKISDPEHFHRSGNYRSRSPRARTDHQRDQRGY